MNELSSLSALGLEIPSLAYLFGLIVFGIIGWVVYRRGRKLHKPALTWSGVGLMLYPYAVSETWLLWAAGVALSAWVYTRWE